MAKDCRTDRHPRLFWSGVQRTRGQKGRVAMSNKPPENKESGDYEIGYAKPPLHTRFRKGHSSNPNGRPRGSKSFATLVNKALEQPVVLRKNGRTMTKREL